MRLEDTASITEKCLFGKPAPCSYGCPYGLDVRAFIERVKQGKWNRAYKQLQQTLIFPYIVSELCPAECGGLCLLASGAGAALNLRGIESACVRFATKKTPEQYRLPPKEGKIAVIGAGVAGLSCALNLSQKNYSVVVFDKAPACGGSLVTHPLFEGFREDIALQFSALRTEFVYGEEIASLDSLQDFSAVYIATGRDGDSFGLKESWNPRDFSTGKAGVFLGGELAVMDKMKAIASGAAASKYIETYMQTGATVTGEKDAEEQKTLMPPPPGREAAPEVRPASSDGRYTAEEAIAESERCFLCDCRRCMDVCEMLGAFNKHPRKIALEAYTDTLANMSLSACCLTRETYSCNMCGRCKSVCPAGIDMSGVFSLARQGRVESGNPASAFHDFWMRDFFFSAGEASFFAPPASRDKRYVFFPGCKLGASMPLQALKACGFLADNYGAGIMQDCCGAPAWWAGEKEIYENHTGRLRAAWFEYGKPVIVYACAYCVKLLKTSLPDAEFVSLYELLDCSYTASADTRKALYTFDPCAAAENGPLKSAIRSLASKYGSDPGRNTEVSGVLGSCCGFGGHMYAANPGLYANIVQNRISLSDDPFLVYCANCAEAFRSAGKECYHILDLVFGVSPDQLPVSFQSKRDNLLDLQGGLAAMYGEEPKERAPMPYDGVKLNIPENIIQKMQQLLVLEDDLKEAVYTAEDTNAKFFDPEKNCFQCRLTRPYVTYWAAYKKEDDASFTILSVYTHRMRFRTDPA